MKKKLFPGGLLLVLLVLALTVGFGLAQEGEPPPEEELLLQPVEVGEESALPAAEPDAPWQPLSLVAEEAVTAPSFTYQGTLTEGGTPVDGSRNMVFTLYSNSTCTTVVQAINKPNVPVTAGVFQVTLAVTAANFNGQALWIEPQVGGTKLGCQAIAAVPYALSLRPGATMIDANTTVVLNHSVETIVGTTRAGVYGRAEGATVNYGVMGTVAGTTGARYGVQGYAFGDGTGGRFYSQNGIALDVIGTGRIRSSAETQLAVNPNDMTTSSTTMTLYPGSTRMLIRPTAASGLLPSTVYIPVDAPSQLYGVPTKLKSIEICYKGANAATYITASYVSIMGKNGTANAVIADTANRTAVTWGCYTLTDATPDVISGPLTVWLSLWFGGTGSGHDIEIGAITATLVE